MVEYCVINHHHLKPSIYRGQEIKIENEMSRSRKLEEEKLQVFEREDGGRL